MLVLVASAIMIVYSCSKGDGGGGGTPNPCAGISVAVTATVTNVTSGANGAINATATGGSGFTFSINGGAFQSSGNFTGLAAGTYTITARNSNNCTGSAPFTVATNLCSGVTINITTTNANTVPCASPSGSITATATGSTGITYSINGTSFQASGNFPNLAAGAYTVTAKDANGCTSTSNVTIQNASAGPLFAAVKTLLQNNCVPCHNNVQSEGGNNWTIDCNIINNKERIKARAVDNNPSSMPPTGPLSQSDKNIITDWINAGGTFSN